MASVVAPGSIINPPQHLGQHAQPQPQPQPQPQVPHGTKRAAESPPENEQRLSKRFDLLNLVDNNGTRLYIPVPGSTDATLPHPPGEAISTPHPLASTMPLKARERRPRPPRTTSDMEVEDTPHRVYIHDLAAEFSEIESDEENPIFLSDIEKHLSKIPRHVLMGPEPKATEYNQMVLYNVPSSLTVSEDKDSVRKAIVEARQRIRDKQASPVTEPVVANNVFGNAMVDFTPPADDVDAMDID